MEKIQVIRCLAERRSKGKLYIARDRITSEACLVRKVYLDVANAGQDDGVPTSILREISVLKSVDHNNLSKITYCQVDGRIVTIVYPYYEKNLKEYFK
jgi:serine/threonine protein kinase